MSLSKLVHRNVKLEERLAIAAIILGILGVLAAQGLFLVYRGFDQGLAVRDASENLVNGIQFAVDGPRTYAYLAGIYLKVAFWMGASTLVQFQAHRSRLGVRWIWALHVTGIVLLTLSLYQLWWIFAEKDLRARSISWIEPSDSLLWESVGWDWFLLLTALILLFTQIVILVLTYFKKNIAK